MMATGAVRRVAIFALIICITLFHPSKAGFPEYAEDISAYFYENQLVIDWRQIKDPKCSNACVVDVSIVDSLTNGVKPQNFEPKTVDRTDQAFKYFSQFHEIFYQPSTYFNITINCLDDDDQLYPIKYLMFKSDPSIPKVEVMEANCNKDCVFNYNVSDTQKWNSYVYIFANETVFGPDVEHLLKRNVSLKEIGLIKTVSLKDGINQFTINKEIVKCPKNLVLLFTNSNTEKIRYNRQTFHYECLNKHGLVSIVAVACITIPLLVFALAFAALLYFTKIGQKLSCADKKGLHTEERDDDETLNQILPHE